MPCLTALFWSLPMERVFRRYMPEEPAGRGYVGEMSALREKIACHDNLDEKADAGNGPRTVPAIFYKLRERTGEMSVL